MSQALRVSQWLPTADPAAANSAVLSNTVPGAGGVIPSRFAVPGGGGGGGDVEEAPFDGVAYARMNGTWVAIDGGTF